MIFASGMLLLGCDQAQDRAKDQDSAQATEQTLDQTDNSQEETLPKNNKNELKNGNVFILFEMLRTYSSKPVTILKSLRTLNLMLSKPFKIKISKS